MSRSSVSGSFRICISTELPSPKSEEPPGRPDCRPLEFEDGWTGEKGDLIRICFRRGHPTAWSVGGSLGGHEAWTQRAMFVRTSRRRSGSSWTSPTCAHGGGRASTRVDGVDVENALFIFGRADTAAVGRSSESACGSLIWCLLHLSCALTREPTTEFTTDVLRRRIHREPPRARRSPRRCGFRPPPHPRHGTHHREHIARSSLP